jgi:hypothetical protein
MTVHYYSVFLEYLIIKSVKTHIMIYVIITHSVFAEYLTVFTRTV